MTLNLAVAAGLLFAIGTYLVLQHRLSRIILGLGLLGHGANILFLVAGRRGAPPIIRDGDTAPMSDPLPQSMVLTAIVITFGVTALLLALAYRSWVLTHDDEVEDDITDRIVARRGFDDDEVADAAAFWAAAREVEP